MKTVQFIFGIHNHQPVGNFDFVIEDAFQRSYRPFIETLERYPSIALSLHFSGCLLEWLEDHHPRFLDRVARLVERGNIEILSAGFYEPILAVIPDHDKLGQIRKMNRYVQDRFGYEAKGVWLTERVWEPHLAKPIHEAGIDYITVDDFHFLAGGKHLNELTGYFNTDEQGKSIGVFPISQRLRYAIPFREPEETIRLLREYASEEGDRVLVMADDGEKFGIWPGTYDRCFGKKRWLDRFFKALEENRDWIKTVTFKEYYQSHPPQGRVYMPTVSYFEMSEWTLPADMGVAFSDLVHDYERKGILEKYRPFFRGGTWRNFLSLYEESNWMLKRTTEISYRLAKAGDDGVLKGKTLGKIRDNVWRAQCNCAYWHGIFGGLYLPHLRHAIYTHLLKAEVEMDKLIGADDAPRDIDNDGISEFILTSPAIKLIISPRGGCIREFDILDKQFNLLDTLRRYRESYHRKVRAAESTPHTGGSIHDLAVSKESNLDRYLQVDQSARSMLMDHFLPPGTTAAEMRDTIPEQGNFLNAVYTVNQENGLTLSKVGIAFDTPVAITKRLHLKDRRLSVVIELMNKGNGKLTGLYGCELNFALLGGHTLDRYYEIDGKKQADGYLDVTADDHGLSKVGLVNQWDEFRVTLSFPKPVNTWRFPVYTVSMSESGFEKVYQSSVVVPYWETALQPGATVQFQFDLNVEEWENSQ